MAWHTAKNLRTYVGLDGIQLAARFVSCRTCKERFIGWKDVSMYTGYSTGHGKCGLCGKVTGRCLWGVIAADIAGLPSDPAWSDMLARTHNLWWSTRKLSVGDPSEDLRAAVGHGAVLCDMAQERPGYPHAALLSAVMDRRYRPRPAVVISLTDLVTS